MLKPQIGTPALFKVPADSLEGAGQPYFAAIVCKVAGDGTVNLAVFDQNGLDAPVQGAVLVQAQDGCPAHFVVPVPVPEPEPAEAHDDEHPRRRHRKTETQE